MCFSSRARAFTPAGPCHGQFAADVLGKAHACLTELPMPDSTEKTISLISCLGYKDADAAVAWLMAAFGFEEHAIYHSNDGKIVHADLNSATA